jgi:tetratricopeptide (TPR) repeat protein
VGRGIALKELNQTEAALLVLREALALTDRHGFPAREWIVEHLADALNREGLARQQRSDLDGALECFLESLEIWRQRSLSSNEGQTLMNIGNIHVMRKQYVEAAGTFQHAEAALLLANDRDGADNVALISGELYVWLDRLDEASSIFRAIVNRATSYQERADRMNRIVELAGKQLKRFAINQALRVLKDCGEWNWEGGYLTDAAACLINIGSIFKSTGDAEGARSSFEKAVILLKDQAQHPLFARAKAFLSSDSLAE